MVYDREVGYRRLRDLACPLVNCRQVIEHLVRLLDTAFEIRENLTYLVPRCGEGRDTILRVLGNNRFPAKLLLKRINDVVCQNGVHTWSIVLNSVACCRAERFRSRSDGIGARSTTWGPTTQLSGRFSVPTAFCNSVNPSKNASGRGGHPGT